MNTPDVFLRVQGTTALSASVMSANCFECCQGGL